MENQDKIYAQFKNAAEKSEGKEFPNSDKIWNRVTEKLDQKVLKKQSKNWRKIAVAASVLLVCSLLYQFLKSDDENINKENVVIQDTISQNNSFNEKTSVAIIETDTTTVLKKEAVTLLKEQLSKQTDVATTFTPNVVSAPNNAAMNAEVATENDKTDNSNIGYFDYNKRKFDAVGVVRNDQKESSSSQESAKKTVQIKTKTDPLLVIDNKAITSKDASTYGKVSNEELAKIKSADFETVVYLKEPLYVIDGKHYSEEELFGEKPTSPYAPLSEQEIKTTKVLQGEEALAAYGEKGANGVLIITTKNGRPVKKISKN